MKKHFSHFLILVAPLLTLTYIPIATASAPPSFTITNIGSPADFAFPMGMNDAGDVVGEFDSPTGAIHAFLWNTTSGIIDLGLLPGDSQSAAFRINNLGQIVGISQPQGGNPPRTFVWQTQSGMTDISAGTSISSQPLAITDQGQIIGSASPDGFLQTAFGFSYTSSTGIIPVTIPGFSVNGVYAINNHGQMALSSPATINVIFYTPNQTPIEIQAPGFSGGAVLDMNDAGTVVGYINAVNANNPHAYIWNQSTGLTDLSPGENTYGFANAINEIGQIVGTIGDGQGHSYAFLYENGTLNNLTNLLDSFGSDWTDIIPQDINDEGEITGSGLLNGNPQAFLLTPISESPTPEPTSLALLTCTVLPLLLKRRNKNMGGGGSQG